MMPGVTPVIPEPTPGPQVCTSNTPGNLSVAGTLRAWGATHLVEGIFSQNLPSPQPLSYP